MKRSLIALVILALGAGAAQAAPGDPRVVQGTLEWPTSLSTEPFVIVRGEDGRLYYADISAAQRRASGPLAVGNRMSIFGVEGNRPHELAAVAFGAGEATGLGISLPGSPTTPAGTLPAPLPGSASAAEAMWQVAGTVQSISGTMVTVRTQDGQAQTVDASQLSVATLRALRTGDRVSLFGTPRADRKLVANGYVQSEGLQPAASPRTDR
jgi:hypothetical protein